MSTLPEASSICLAITELHAGGAERCLTQLACGLAGHPGSIRVLSLAPLPRGETAGLVDQLRNHAIPIDSLEVTRPRQFLTARRRLYRYLVDHDVRLLQTFLYHANVLAASLPRRFPCIHVSGIRVADPRRWRKMIESRAARRWDHAVCVSEDVAVFTRDALQVAPHDLTVIPNAVDTERFQPAQQPTVPPAGLPPGRRYLTCVGRLDPQKGLDWLLPITPRIIAQCPDHDLLLVGDGPDRETLEALVRSLGLQQRVHFLGWRADIPQILQATDVLLLPSRWEGMPNVVMEAMSCGLPVVCRAVHGIPALLGNDPQQRVPLDSPREAFAQCTVDLASDRQLRSDVGGANRSRIQDRFSMVAMVDAYRGLYARLLADS